MHHRCHKKLSEVRGVTGWKHYSDLARFFEDFRKADLIPVEQLPNQEVVEAAKEEIRQNDERLMHELAQRWLDAQLLPDCPRSPDGNHRVPAGGWYPSRLGGLIFQGRCNCCGGWVDTHEFFD